MENKRLDEARRLARRAVSICQNVETLEFIRKVIVNERIAEGRPAKLEQAMARVPNRNRTYSGFGRDLSAAEWARCLGLPRNSVWKYLQRGHTPEEIAEARGVAVTLTDN